MPRMRTTILAVVLPLAVLVAGCGGSSSDSAKTNTIQSTPTQTTPTTTTPTTSTATPGGGGAATTPNTPTTPPDTSTATGGTPSNGGTGSGGVYPGQQPANPSQSPGERYRQYCAAHPSACGD